MRSLASLKVVEDDLRRRGKLQRPVATSINLFSRFAQPTPHCEFGRGWVPGRSYVTNYSKYRWKCVFVGCVHMGTGAGREMR